MKQFGITLCALLIGAAAGIAAPVVDFSVVGHPSAGGVGVKTLVFTDEPARVVVELHHDANGKVKESRVGELLRSARYSVVSHAGERFTGAVATPSTVMVDRRGYSPQDAERMPVVSSSTDLRFDFELPLIDQPGEYRVTMSLGGLTSVEKVIHVFRGDESAPVQRVYLRALADRAWKKRGEKRFERYREAMERLRVLEPDNPRISKDIAIRSIGIVPCRETLRLYEESGTLAAANLRKNVPDGRYSPDTLARLEVYKSTVRELRTYCAAPPQALQHARAAFDTHHSTGEPRLVLHDRASRKTYRTVAEAMRESATE